MVERLNPDGSSVYYQHSGSVPLASRVSLYARRKMFRLFMDYCQPGPDTSVLDVGVTSDTSMAESNYFEHMYPHPDKIVCVGTENGSHLMNTFPGLQYRQVRGGDPLPFADRAFDVVFSNAVLEHVGSRESQRGFLRELCRVGKSVFVTTPNRWFPVEHHTGLPLVHHLPPALFRRLLRQTKYDYWADEAHLNLMGGRELAQLFPADVRVAIRRVRVAGFASNLVAFGRHAA